jgi:hypothetical protein
VSFKTAWQTSALQQVCTVEQMEQAAVRALIHLYMIQHLIIHLITSASSDHEGIQEGVRRFCAQHRRAGDIRLLASPRNPNRK